MPAAMNAPAEKPTGAQRGSRVPRPIDVLVGKRIRARRLLLRMEQKTLASRLGLTFQQVHKYETGANRISASRLSETASILGVPISYFFTGLADMAPAEPLSCENMERPEVIELIRIYYAIPDVNLRQQVIAMAKRFAKGLPPLSRGGGRAHEDG